jgi:copper chaperone CopZ
LSKAEEGGIIELFRDACVPYNGEKSDGYAEAGGQGIMEKISLKVGKTFCDGCSMALRRFIGHMDGIEHIDIEAGRVAISFDEAKITEEDLIRIAKDSIEKLGYNLDEP